MGEVSTLAPGNSRSDSRIALAILTGWLIIFAFGVAVIRPWNPAVPLSNDFISFWTGASFIRNGAGGSLFDMDAQARFQSQLREAMTGTAEIRPGVVLDPFHSPPAQGFILLPLTLLPFQVAYIAMGAVSLLTVLGVVALQLRGYPWGKSAAALMIASAPVADTLLFGQVNAQFVAGLGLGVLAMSRGLPFVGGALLGILWLKPQYAVLFLALFLVKRRWRELAGIISSGAAIAAVSTALVGPDGVLRFLRVLSEIGGFYPPPDSFIFPQSMVNWRGLLVSLFPGIAAAEGWLLMSLLGLFTAAGALLAFAGPWDASSSVFPRQMLAVAIASIVASPHSNFHGLVIILGVIPFVVAKPLNGARFERTLWWLIGALYLVSVGVWPFKGYSFILVPLLLGIITVLVIQCRGVGRNRAPTAVGAAEASAGSPL